MNPASKKLLNEAIKNDQPFAIYHLPETANLSVIIQKSKNLKTEPFKKIEELKGFCVAPFRGEKVNQLICLSPDEFFEEPLSQVDSADFANILHVSKSTNQAYVMKKQEYLERVSYLTEILKQPGTLRKVVLSRVIDYPLPKSFDAISYLIRLIEKYPSAFVYLVNLPGIGIWLGATPEVLLRIMDDYAETVALAGTQVVGQVNWTEKEIKEQQIVSDYIEEQLNKYGIDEFVMEGPEDVEAGPLVHIKTTYYLPINYLKGHTGGLLAGLHPTPAVCGLPRNKAYGLLQKVEKHDRAFYTGFIGPWQLNGASHLFVNLRCAQLSEGRMSLFVGGGITAQSVAEAEWEETERKSKTLLSVVEKM